MTYVYHFLSVSPTRFKYYEGRDLLGLLIAPRAEKVPWQIVGLQWIFTVWIHDRLPSHWAHYEVISGKNPTYHLYPTRPTLTVDLDNWAEVTRCTLARKQVFASILERWDSQGENFPQNGNIVQMVLKQPWSYVRLWKKKIIFFINFLFKNWTQRMHLI